MTIDAFQKQLDKVVTNIISTQLPDFFAMVIENDIIAEVQTRLQEKGELASGEKPSYSTNPALVGYPSDSMQQNYSVMYKKAYTALKKNKESNWATVNGHKLVEAPGGYKQIRDLGGYQTNHVDFTVSNSMLRSVKIKSNKTDGKKIVITYGVTGQKEIDKVTGHNERYGENILMPNNAELERAKIRIQKQLIRFINEGLI
jgi:hypothetical protein